MPDTYATERSAEEEAFGSFPEGYRIGKTKYIVITGSVMSSVGKGTISSSLATLLSCSGFKVEPVKFDGYLNYDAGTLNPFRHGEVFVLDDGTECDLDMGTYERSLNKDLKKDNYLTAGKIFKNIIDKERKGGFLGRDVQFIPHVTGEIKRYLRDLALKSDADIVTVEVGGTVGDLENSYFIEAMRELRYEEGRPNVCPINVTYIIRPGNLGEFKTKAAQLGVRKLMELGFRPEIVICRSELPVDKNVREKISIVADVGVERVYNLWDMKNIYSVPLMLRELGMDREICKMMELKPKVEVEQGLVPWRSFVERTAKAEREINIGIVGKYTYVHDSYLSVIKALEHAASGCGVKLRVKWVESADLEKPESSPEEVFRGIDGAIVPGGFGRRGTEGKIAAIGYIRRNRIPYLGLCLGMQLAVVEYARNVCGMKDANSTEFNANTSAPVIDILPGQEELIKESRYGGTLRLGLYPAVLREGSIVAGVYGNTNVFERHRHRYEVNPKYIEIIEKAGMIFSGRSPSGILMEFMELKEHPYFVGTQAHPELKSRPVAPAPLFVGLMKAAIERRNNMEKPQELTVST